MELFISEQSNEVAIVQSNEPVITDVQSALDLMATVSYEKNCQCLIINKSAVIEEFFDLSTRIAGDILQKYVTYNFKFAIVGDFFGYDSKSLKDFIYESNKGKHFFFVATNEEAVEKLTKK